MQNKKGGAIKPRQALRSVYSAIGLIAFSTGYYHMML
jgi:hypothetical protein